MRFFRIATTIGLLLWSIAAIYFSTERHLLTEEPTYR